jgi:electron transfer flavoprotein alpha/beta subunit
MGADDAILVEAEDNLDSYSIAKALKEQLRNQEKLQMSFLLVNKVSMMTAYKFHRFLQR